MARIDEMLPLISGPDILDVGCTGHEVLTGSPHWVHGRLREAFPGADVWGIDIAADRIKEMQELGLKKLAVADAQDFSLDKTFDTIVAGEIIEHLESPGRFLSCARAHLKPQGRIVLTTPYPFGLVHLIYATAKFPKTCTNAEHAVWLCPSTMREQADRSGLRIEHFHLFRQATLRGGPVKYDSVVRLTRLLPMRIGATNALYVLVPA